jgi:hypothetical protein
MDKSKLIQSFDDGPGQYARMLSQSICKLSEERWREIRSLEDANRYHDAHEIKNIWYAEVTKICDDTLKAMQKYINYFISRDVERAVTNVNAKLPEMPHARHASDCRVWVGEPCDCVTGKDVV